MKYEKFYWLNDDSRKFLSRGYLSEGETAESRIREIADKAEWYLKDMTLSNKDKSKFDGFADKFYEYMSRGYYSLSSPVWANYGKKRGLPVSCFGSYIDDNMESILYGVAENGMLMKNGGGCSGYFGAVRPRGAPITDQGESSGSVHFMQMYDTLASVVSQGSVRRGFFAAYQDIEHSDADEFLDIGTEGNPIQSLTTSVIVSDEFIDAVKAGDAEKRRLWAKVLQRRSEIGYPYIMFSGNVNRNKPQVYIDKNKTIHASQMCSEIALPSSVDETFTCVLSSINLLHWDEIKHTDAIEVLTMFLDTVNEEFVRKSTGQEYLKRARQFAMNHRALGVGVLGWHSYLQSKMIGFESSDAAELNHEIAKTFAERSHAASRELAVLLGEAPILEGYGMRNTTTMAIAPTKSCVVPETEFLDGSNNSIDYYTFCERGGLNLKEIMSVEIEFENGSKKIMCYDDKIQVEGDEVYVYELLNDRKEFCSIKTNENTWYTLNPGVEVMTNDGPKTCTRFYFNGFHKTKKIFVEDGTVIETTDNHQLMVNGQWTRADQIQEGDSFNNSLLVIKVEDGLVKPTMDMEVPDLHYYLLPNGIMSHNSSFILGQVSQSIEPEFSNCYVKDLAKMKVTIKNPYLKKLLSEKDKDTDKVWESIKIADGSVQHLDFLTKNEKDVFKTFSEIDPYAIIDQASVRQKYIDQSQSLNLMLDPDMSVKEINTLYLYAHQKGIKNLYYAYSMSKAQSLTRKKLTASECAACEA